MAGRRETETLKPIDKVSLGEITSHRAVMRVNAKWPRKQMNPGAEPTNEGRRQHGVPKSVDQGADLARCFLRLANLPSFPLDRLSRYEAVLWRQAGQILFALDALDRRKPQDRGRRFRIASRQHLPPDGRDDY